MALAALQAVFCLLPGLGYLSYALAGGGVLLFVLGGLFLVLSAATVFAAVRLYRGVDVRMLAVLAVLLAVVWLVYLVLALALVGAFDPVRLLLLALAVGVVVLTRKPDVRAWAA